MFSNRFFPKILLGGGSYGGGGYGGGYGGSAPGGGSMFFFLCELILFVHEYGCYKNQFLGGWSGEGGGRGLGESSNSGGWSGQGKF